MIWNMSLPFIERPDQSMLEELQKFFIFEVCKG